MANQEVVNAINETMVPNGVKAINADSVRNLLLLMAEKMGEGTGSGSGSGAVRVHISDGSDLDFSQVNYEEEGLFTPEEVELIKSMITKAQQDNKAAYKLLNEHRDQGIVDLVMGDESLFMIMTLIFFVRMYEEYFNQLGPELNVDWSAFSFNGVAGYPMYYTNGKTDTSGIDADSLALLDEFFGDVATDLENSMFNGIVLSYDAMLTPYYVLKEDGSVFYFEDTTIPTEEYEPIIYLSESNEMTEDLLEANKKAYLKGSMPAYAGVFWSVRENFISLPNGSSFQERGGCVHEVYSDLSTTPMRQCFRFWKGTDMLQVTVYEDGNATLEVYASINPTA